MKFRFRLEKAEHFYSQREAAKKLELANVLAQLAKLKGELDQIEQENREVFSQNSQIQTVAAPWIQIRMERVEANLASIKRVETDMETVLKRLEDIKNELTAISKRKKALEKVREKKLEEFKIKRAHTEQKKLDENYQILELIKE
ncbi:MAG: flagellar FliJ family protein [Pseudomonadota bacterium]